METQVEDVGPCKKLLKIEIPPERVDEELEKSYRGLGEGVIVPGFRKGHVPRWLMESRFGKQVDDDTKQTLISDSFEEAVKENELRPIGAPKFDEDIPFEHGKPLTFGVTIEVHPEFEIDDYTNIELKKPATRPKKAEIDERVNYVRRRYAKLDEVSEGAPQADDIAVVHVRLREGGNVYKDIPNHQFIVGDHALIGMNGEETTALVTGANVGDTVEKEVKIPDLYQDEAKRGATMTLELKLEGIRRPILPRLTEKWVKEIGFESLAQFKDEIKTAVERDKERQAQAKLEEQLTEQLAKKADFELPENVISNMAERALIRRGLALRQQGAPPEEIEKQLDKLRAESKESAQKAAKLYFILDKIADKERVFVTEDEVDARIEAIAANYGRSPEQVRRELENEDRLSELRSTMREEKSKAFLLEKATIKEPKTPSKSKGNPDK